MASGQEESAHAPVFIRTAANRDIPSIRALLGEAWHATYDDIYGVEKVTAITSEWHSIEALEKQRNTPGSEFVIADTGTQILGMAYATQHAKTVKLHQLYVSPAAQGRNIETELLQEIIFCLDGADEITLEVDPSNTGAIGFYEAFGFHKSGETANCGQDASGIPAHIFSLKL